MILEHQQAEIAEPPTPAAQSGDEVAAYDVANTRRAAWGSAVGSVVEWYDFALYGSAVALVFSTEFFPSSNPSLGLLAGFATFAVGYLIRPLGGVVFGHLGDRLGRKPIMFITLILMGLSTAGIGLLPTYQHIGFWAPLLLVVLRMFEGLGAGAEYAGAVVLSAESSEPAHRGYYSSWSGAAAWIGSALGTLAFQAMISLSGDGFLVWGWRVPFLLSLALVGLSFFIRFHVDEPTQLQSSHQHGDHPDVPFMTLLAGGKRRLAIGIGSNLMLSGFSYIPQVWILSYLLDHEHVAQSSALWITTGLLLLAAPTVPLFGMLGDRIGRRRLMLFSTVCGIIMPIPMFAVIDIGNPWLTLVALLMCFVFAVATSYAAQAAFLPELFPPSLRYSGVAFSREFSGAIFAGTAPLVATWLVSVTGNWHGVAAYMMVFALAGFISAYYSKYFRQDEHQHKNANFNAPA